MDRLLLYSDKRHTRSAYIGLHALRKSYIPLLYIWDWDTPTPSIKFLHSPSGVGRIADTQTLHDTYAQYARTPTTQYPLT